MKRKYNSPMNVSHRKHVYISDNDPRAKSRNALEKYKSKIGAIVIVKKSRIRDAKLEEYNEE